MVTQILSQLTFFAQEAGAAAAQQPKNTAGQAFSMTCMIFFFLIAMYLLFVLPKQKQDKKMKLLYDSLKKDDKVMTSCGIIASVYSVDKEAGEIVLKVDDSNNTKIRFSISSIYYVFPKAEDSETGKKQDK